MHVKEILAIEEIVFKYACEGNIEKLRELIV
jgi:hypothetical protein